MNKVKTWEEIEDDFRRMDSMSCRPNFTKLPKIRFTSMCPHIATDRKLTREAVMNI